MPLSQQTHLVAKDVHDVSVHETLGALSRELEVELLRSRLLSRLVQHGNLEVEEKASASSARLSKRVWDFGIDRERERDRQRRKGRTDGRAGEDLDPPSRVPCPTQPNPPRGACSSLTSATCALVTLLHATCVALGPTRPAHASGLPTNEVRAAMVYASLCPGPSRPRQPTCATLLRLDPCALVFEVASKNFSPRLDKLPGPCGGLPVSADPSRNLVLGGGAVGRAEIIAVSKSFSIFPNGNVFEVDENVLTSEDKRALERTGVTPASSTSKSTENQRGILKNEMRMRVCFQV